MWLIGRVVVRHALVVGSQCDALGETLRLSFLPDRAERLFEVLTDPSLGGCERAPVSVLLLDPTMEQLKTAVLDSVKRAAAVRATLMFAYIGHAVRSPTQMSRPLFLLPTDADADAPMTDTAYQVGSRLGELGLADLDGLILILDACHAGAGVRDVVESSLDLKTQVRLELLASTFLREAYDGCFTGSMIDLLRHGRPELSSDYLDIETVANVATGTCQNPDPPIYHGAGVGRDSSDPGLFVSRNVASPNAWPLTGTEEGSLAVEMTGAFQVTHDVERVRAALDSDRLVLVEGPAGSGKSVLVAALARPELVPDLPRRYLAGVAFTAVTNTLDGIADSLHRQLRRIPQFIDAAERHQVAFAGEVDRQPALERWVFGPLRIMEPLGIGKRIRIAIDGVDQLDPANRSALLGAVTNSAADPRLQQVGLLLSSRPSAE